MSAETTPVITPETALEAYRRGYEIGYYYGRLAQINGEGYDARTPLQKAEGTAEHNGGSTK